MLVNYFCTCNCIICPVDDKFGTGPRTQPVSNSGTHSPARFLKFSKRAGPYPRVRFGHVSARGYP